MGSKEFTLLTVPFIPNTPLGILDPTKLGGGVYRDVKFRYFFYTVKFSFTNFWDIFRVISRKFWSYLGGGV